MMRKNLWFLLILLLVGSALAAVDSTQISLVNKYQDWNWDAWVMENGLITIATVPVIGGRTMQYDLGGHPSIYVNSRELGKTYTPANDNNWPNFGGFKNWPAPQSVWNWPPPPTLDHGEFTATVMANTPDSVSLQVTSPIEKWDSPNLQFTRLLTIYQGSSRVKVDQTMINKGNSKQNWSMWDITQAIVMHPGKKDYSNFWVYFPINPNSIWGEDGVRYDNNSAAWVGEVAPGIYGVQFKNEGKKIFADSDRGWICYVDELDGYAYAKTFTIFEGAEYPDQGAHVEVWIDNEYLEVEVVSPIMELAAKGGEYTFTENWWAAKVDGPIVDVNNVGAIKTKLHNNGKGELEAVYGVFHVGTARLVYLNGDHVVNSGDPIEVTPLETLNLKTDFNPPESILTNVEVWIYDANGNKLGVLDSVDYTSLITGINESNNETPSKFILNQNYPNPFNPVTTIEFSLPVAGKTRLAVYDITGKEIALLVNGALDSGTHHYQFDGGNLASGVYMYRLQSDAGEQVGKMLLMK
ncbi:MAG TPA: T9SS type A sorting domain-containing protein [bacterium]|nr:T9SS type A sorting domain-containing protein [bacterium]